MNNEKNTAQPYGREGTHEELRTNSIENEEVNSGHTSVRS